MKLLNDNDLEFHKLIEAKAYVYLYKNHPLANKTSISFEELRDYPCLFFEQGDDSSFYLNEEILSTMEYPKIIHTNDRSSNLNLMVGLNAYTLCSGIICEELNGDDYIAVPFKSDKDTPNSIMEIGYITKTNTTLSQMGKEYIEEMKKYLGVED
jgi:DNA-binding transcriptional LysR family regulator